MRVLMDSFDSIIAPSIPGPSPKDKALRIGIYRNIFYLYVEGTLKSYPPNTKVYPEDLFKIAQYILIQFPEENILSAL